MGVVRPRRTSRRARHDARRILGLMDERATPHGADRCSAATGSRSSARWPGRARTCAIAGYVIAVGRHGARDARVPPVPRRHHAAQQGVRVPRGGGCRRGDRRPRARHRGIGPRVPLLQLLLPPAVRQWTIARPEYVAVLFAFLALSVIISELLARAAERARTAEAREAELRTIQELSRELTTRVPGEDTIEVALLHVKNAFGYEAGGVVRRADRGRARPGPAGDGRGAAGVGDARHGIPARRSSRPSGSRCPSAVGCSGWSC